MYRADISEGELLAKLNSWYWKRKVHQLKYLCYFNVKFQSKENLGITRKDDLNAASFIFCLTHIVFITCNGLKTDISKVTFNLFKSNGGNNKLPTRLNLLFCLFVLFPTRLRRPDGVYYGKGDTSRILISQKIRRVKA